MKLRWWLLLLKLGKFRWVRRLIFRRSMVGKAFHRDRRGATSLEYCLLIAAIGIPTYLIIFMAFDLIVSYYEMSSTLNALPFP